MMRVKTPKLMVAGHAGVPMRVVVGQPVTNTITLRASYNNTTDTKVVIIITYAVPE